MGSENDQRESDERAQSGRPGPTAGRRGNACGVSGLRDHLADGSERERSCVLQRPLAESVVAFERHLALASGSSTAAALSQEHHLDLLDRAPARVPPDPLLPGSIEKLGPANK